MWCGDTDLGSGAPLLFFALSAKVVNFDVSPHRRLPGELTGEIISPVKKLVKFISIISTHLGTFCVAAMPHLTLMHLPVGDNRGSRPFLSISNIFLPFPLPYLL